MKKKLQDPFYGKLFALVLPIAAQNLLSALVSASDALMLGLVDQASLSSVSLAAQVQFVLNLFPRSFFRKPPVLPLIILYIPAMMSAMPPKNTRQKTVPMLDLLL